MKPFLNDAEIKASEFGVNHLCTFIEKDIKKYADVKHYYDIVILASLGNVLGSLKNSAAKLRSQVKSNGYIIIDDGYLKDKILKAGKGYEHYKNYDESVKDLTAFGDRILYEIDTNEISSKINYEFLELIRKRGNELILSNPGMAKEINNYIKTQEDECHIISSRVNGILWVVQKNETG